MSRTRRFIPVFCFGVLAAITAGFGLYVAAQCLRAVVARQASAWSSFLVAEGALLFAGRFLNWTLIALAVARGKVREVRVRPGGCARILFGTATLAAGLGYLVIRLSFDVPWWFTHVGHGVIAVLLFCAFTYPWSRRPRIMPTSGQPAPTVPPILTTPPPSIALRRPRHRPMKRVFLCCCVVYFAFVFASLSVIPTPMTIFPLAPKMDRLYGLPRPWLIVTMRQRVIHQGNTNTYTMIRSGFHFAPFGLLCDMVIAAGLGSLPALLTAYVWSVVRLENSPVV